MAVAIQKIVKFLFNDKPENQRENIIKENGRKYKTEQEGVCKRKYVETSEKKIKTTL